MMNVKQMMKGVKYVVRAFLKGNYNLFASSPAKATEIDRVFVFALAFKQVPHDVKK